MDKRIHFYALNYNGIRETAPLYMWLYKSHPDNNHAEISHPLPAGAAPVLIVTHKTTRTALNEAIAAFKGTDVVHADPVAIRIEEI